jgi:hypothetical protein
MFPFPAGIGQVLEAYAKIRTGLSMGRAFEAVAAERGVNPSTVRSACTRNLFLSAADFETLTRPGRERDFERFMLSRYPLLRVPLLDFLRSLPPGRTDAAGPERSGRESTGESPGAEQIADMLTAWSMNSKIPTDIRRQMQQLAATLHPNPF